MDMKYELAQVFSRLLVSQIGDDNWHKVIELNDSESDARICHSHDFCDANQIMLDACEELSIPADDVTSEEFVTLTDAAWDIAKSNDFDVNAIQQEAML
jgi:hypothetical protein